MIETHTRILGIAPYDGMRTAMEQAAQAYPNVEMDIYTGDLEDGQAIVQQMPPNSYDCIISRGGTAALIRQDRPAGGGHPHLGVRRAAHHEAGRELFQPLRHRGLPLHHRAGPHPVQSAGLQPRHPHREQRC